ncbi:MAG: hypothetical protein IPN34_19465 [Planctomycetes bacterium]|nr:hypothetical protein [Planctomycetota bacterium]
MDRLSSNDRRVALALSLAGAALAALVAWLSESVYQDDDLTHLQMAAWSCSDPRYLLDSWGRPGFTVLYALPAALGWLPARLFSVLLSACVAWWSYAIARELRVRWAAIVPALVWLQPLFFTLSTTTLTETALAFYLTLAFRLLQQRRFTASAALISLAMLTRHEAVLLTGLWGLAFLRERPRWSAWLALGWAPLAHNLLALAFLGRAPVQAFFEPKPTTIYGSGEWLTMWLHAHVAFSSALLLAACAGALALARRRGALLWIASGALWLAAHSLIFRFGLFASAGYPRFLVPIAGIVGVAAAVGLERTTRLMHLPRRSALASSASRGVATGCALFALLTVGGAATALPVWIEWARAALLLATALLLVLAIAMVGGRAGAYRAWLVLFGILACMQLGVLWFGRPPLGHFLPHAFAPDQLVLRDAASWMRRERPQAPGWISASPWAEVFLGGERSWSGPSLAERARALPRGGLFLWDAKYAPLMSPAHTREELLASGAWREIHTGEATTEFSGPFACVLEKIVDGP